MHKHSNIFKLTCFYCKYEIHKYNKSNKYIKFKNQLKPLCRYCTSKKHKPLEIIYKDIDTQCRICRKPVMYKKCIACSICDHFYHEKCLNLSKDDITKIETICNFYLCPICNENALPNLVDTIKLNRPNVEVLKTSKQCFTCINKISKEKYTDKYFIYNDRKRCVSKECSCLGRNIPVREKNYIEFLDCSVCKNEVKYEAIFCDLCQHWVHPYCNGIDKNELKELSSNHKRENWHCIKCSSELYPNYLLNVTGSDKVSLKVKSKDVLKSEFVTHDDCSICLKKVSGHETISCSTCNHWIHKKCIGYFKNRTEYQNFLHYYSTKPWDCPACTSEMLPFVLLDNEEFYMLLLDMFSEPSYLNKENFQQIYAKLNNVNFFNCPDASNDPEKNKYLNEIDPDQNFHTIDSCNYIIDIGSISIKSTKELTMMTFNIRSLKKNLNNYVNQILSKLNCKVHVICLTESWLGPLDNIKDFTLDGYHPPKYQNRIGNLHGGGVITYVHKDITKIRAVKNLSFVDEFNHCLATEITINNKSATFLNIYRSPNKLNDSFIDKFDIVIDKAKSKFCYVLGDMNYNLINVDKHDATRSYYNLLTSSSFKPLITKPTRITDNGQTLIDHIWTNDLRNTSLHKSQIVITDITDHFPCITVVSSPDITLKGYQTISSRVINDENRTKFVQKITDVKDSLFFHIKNVHQPSLEQKYNDYFFHLSKVYEECFPIKTKKVHTKTLSKPWITPEVQKLIDKKNVRFSKKHKNRTEENNKKFKEAKENMDEAIDKEKNKYYKNLIEGTNNNARKKWNAIRTIINRKKTEQSSCPIPNNILGQHYSTVAEKLAEKLQQLEQDDIPNGSKHSNNRNLSRQTFSFNHTTDREVYELILKLDSSKGPGIDNMDIKSLKSVANIISPHLSSLFNLSITNGIYPQCFKIAKCVPVFKGSPLDPSLPVNYRPVSILTAINKTFEQILHRQLTTYLEDHKLLPPCQYGYRKKHNTSQAILDFTDCISKALKDNMVTIAIFMDLSKAFDTVDKSILKHKLEDLGLDEMSTLLIDSYMSNRRFCMSNDNAQYNLSYGVPQGSILGPLLFIMYIYDMTNITEENKSIVYADDTTVLVKGKNLLEAKQHCNDILTRFHQYFTLNKLSINPSKTKFMVYKPSYRGNQYKKLLVDVTNTNVTMADSILEQVSSIKFLGVTITDKLTWEAHKQQVYNKVCKTLGILYRCKDVMDDKELLKMYKTFIQPYFLYAIEVWGHTVLNSEQDILIKLQSKVLRLIFNCKRSDDAWRHNNGQIKSIKHLYSDVIKKICLKHHYELLPCNFSKFLMPDFNAIQLQNRVTRISLEQMYNYRNSFTSTNTPFKYNCVKIWNSQSVDLKTLPYTSSKEALFKSLKL